MVVLPLFPGELAVGDPDLTFAEVVLAYLKFAEGYSGEDSKVRTSLHQALRPVNHLYGSSRARDFGPRPLKAVRQPMIDLEKRSRGEINRRIGRIKRAFKWTVSEELVPGSCFHGLQTVPGLRRGRSEAREMAP